MGRVKRYPLGRCDLIVDIGGGRRFLSVGLPGGLGQGFGESGEMTAISRMTSARNWDIVSEVESCHRGVLPRFVLGRRDMMLGNLVGSDRD